MKIDLCKHLILLAFILPLACQTPREDPLFSYGGKNVYSQDLTTKEQDRLKKAHVVYDSALRLTLDNYVVERFLADESKRTGKTVAQLRKDLLEADNPSDAEVDQYYLSNRKKIPYPRKVIDAELRQIVRNEKQSQKRRALLARIYQEKRVKIVAVKDSGEKK